MEDQQLQMLRAGDVQAFRELVTVHHRALVATGSAIVGVDDAEEVVQNAWIKAHRAIANFEGRSSLRTWLTRIVINEAKQWLRGNARRETTLGLDGPDPLSDRFRSDGHWQNGPAHWDTGSPDALLTSEELADCLSRILTEMPDQQRSLLELRDVDGLPFDEICNELAISPSNARVLLHRARTRLFGLVDHFQETGEC